VTERPVVFLHVMKCGGTSVRAGLATGLTGARHGPAVVELDGRAAKAAAGGTIIDDWAFRDALLSYVLATQDPAVVMGHFRYRNRHAPLLERAHVVTVLRDPVERLLSLYRYRRYGAGVDLPLSRSLEEQVSSDRWVGEGHRYVSTFCGRDDLDPRSDAAVAASVANLRRFALVGAAEQLDRFGERLSALVGVPITFPVLNASPAPEPEPTSEIDPHLLTRLRDLCAADAEVYAQVVGSPR
jgi:hypothetical protein